MGSRAKVLGISASLRNARRGLGNQDLIAELNSIKSQQELTSFLKQEAETHLRHFKEAGRDKQVAFDELYKNLRKLKGNRGLSNSEVALAAALWAAKELKTEIDHFSLSEHFNEEGEIKNIELLSAKIQSADAIIISGPVYFGDRGSLVQSFFNLLRSHPQLKNQLEMKIYAGVAVGAKRNGGQETTLIYQLWDALHLGMLGVGNDSQTTSQYGGTGHAGDIGTMPRDHYGLETAMGTGRRVARVAQQLRLSNQGDLQGGLKIGFMVLQDHKALAEKYINQLVQSKEFIGEAEIINIAEKSIKRCLACDVCPTHIDLDSVYRCIIKSKNDDLSDLHHHFLKYDAVIPVVVSPRERGHLRSNYQKFLERTRYIRRGDYVLSDLMLSPLVIEEVGANENLSLRLLTSMMRHHTILSKPLTLYYHREEALNLKEVQAEFNRFGALSSKMTVGRLASYSESVDHLKYKPVGYVLSALKDEEDERLRERKTMIEERIARAQKEFGSRVKNSKS